MYLILLSIFPSLCLGFGFQATKIDDILGTNGIFKEQTIFADIGQFTNVLNVPGVLETAYANYADKFGKSLTLNNQDIFKSNILTVFGHNVGELSSFKMGINYFSDMTPSQIRSLYTGANLPNINTTTFTTTPPPHPSRQPRANPPDSKDWRQYGIVTKPKNQGQCGSCTLFALAGALESAMALYKGKKDLDLSEQELLDCPNGNGVARCRGNWPEDIYEYMKKPGVTTEAEYPYEAKESKCRATSKSHNSKVTNYYKTTSGDENMLKDYIATYGVLSVIIEINDDFSKYKSGVFNVPCSNTRYDHSVLAVGYGSENGQDYWIVKNSWGEGWGDKGYIKMARNKKSLCRIADYAILPQA